jgi:Flp pilus assembly pilin Flp
MTKIASIARSFVRDEDGATMIEYGLMVALIAVVCNRRRDPARRGAPTPRSAAPRLALSRRIARLGGVSRVGRTGTPRAFRARPPRSQCPHVPFPTSPLRGHSDDQIASIARSFVRDEDGATMIEYGLMVASSPWSASAPTHPAGGILRTIPAPPHALHPTIPSEAVPMRKIANTVRNFVRDEEGASMVEYASSSPSSPSS